MDRIKSTRENIQEAINGETYEFTRMYPGMIAAAEAEGNSAAVRTFSYANDVEKIHAGLYQKALSNLDKKESVPYYVCPVCGNTFEKDAPEICPICSTSKKLFKKIE